MSENGKAGLPAGWAETVLGEVLPLSYGKGLTEKNRNNTGSVPVYGSSGIVGQHSQALTSGPTLVVGRKGSVGEVHYSPVPCWPIDTTYFVEATESTNLRFFGYLLKAISLGQFDKSTTIPGLSRDDYNAIKVAVAPLAEQHRIVAEIEKQFTRLDAGVVALERAQANLKRYRASVLKAACEGRLVPTEAELARAEGRDYEPADRLLARILKERRAKWEADQVAKIQAQGKVPKDDKWKEKYQEPAGPDTADLPELPEGWVWTTVDAMLAESLCNGISVKGRDTPPGVAALKLNAMSERGFKYQFVRYLPIDEKLAKELEVVAGDFFVSRGNGSLTLVGRGTLAQGPPFQVVFPDTMIRLRLLGIVKLTAWVPTIWSAQFVRRQIEQRVKTTAVIWKIAQPEVASIVLPLPPLDEQSRIVAEVERRLSVIDELEAVVSANLKRAERLRQSILKRAFKGKLVPQDPNDEPASVLLERIRAERQVEQKATAKAISKASQKSKRPQVAETQAELFR
jgi:type I restriction enzyme S subunit